MGTQYKAKVAFCFSEKKIDQTEDAVRTEDWPPCRTLTCKLWGDRVLRLGGYRRSGTWVLRMASQPSASCVLRAVSRPVVWLGRGAPERGASQLLWNRSGTQWPHGCRQALSVQLFCPFLGQKGAGCREVLRCPANLDVLAQDSEGTEQGAASFEMLGPASYCQPALL